MVSAWFFYKASGIICFFNSVTYAQTAAFNKTNRCRQSGWRWRLFSKCGVEEVRGRRGKGYAHTKLHKLINTTQSWIRHVPDVNMCQPCPNICCVYKLQTAFML